MGNDMLFQNEIISEDVAREFGIIELLNKYRPFRKLPSPLFIYDWTINDERDVFLVEASLEMEIGGSGRDEPNGVTVFALSVHGTVYEARMFRNPEKSSPRWESPYRLFWELKSLKLLQGAGAPNLETKEILKTALTVRGMRGAHRHIPNTVVSFDF